MPTPVHVNGVIGVRFCNMICGILISCSSRESRHFQISHNTLFWLFLAPRPQHTHMHCLHFSLGDWTSQEKMMTMLKQNCLVCWGERNTQTKCIVGGCVSCPCSSFVINQLSSLWLYPDFCRRNFTRLQWRSNIYRRIV